MKLVEKLGTLVRTLLGKSRLPELPHDVESLGQMHTPDAEEAKLTRQPDAIDASDSANMSESSVLLEQSVDSRSKLQSNLTEMSKRPRVTDVVIGFDFGTSASKLVIQTPYYANRRAVAVPASAVIEGLTGYLIPSNICLSTGAVEANVSLGHGNSSTSNLKIRVYENPDDVDAQARVVSYIASVLRAAKRWYLNESIFSLSNVSPRWSFNLGIPTAGYNDDDIRRCFTQIARAAWLLSEGSEPIDLELCYEGLREINSREHDGSIDVVPEIAAAVVGYAKSRHRREGLHFMVDVGALTTDACGFLLYDDDDGDNYGILVSEVQPLGSAQLHLARLEITKEVGCPESIKSIDCTDPLAQIPDSIFDYLPEGCPEAGRLYRLEETQFRVPFERQLWRCLIPLHRDRAPTDEHWQTGLPVFIGGGGGNAKWYRTVMRDVSVECTERLRDVGDFKFRTLPKPAQLVGKNINDTAFQRLAVAFGLSFDRFDRGRIRQPDQIPDIPRPKIRKPAPFISKDQV